MRLFTASVFFTMYSTFCYCKDDLSERSSEDQRKIADAKKLLGGNDTLFLVSSENAWYQGRYICWSSIKTGNVKDGYSHNITYYVTEPNSTGTPELVSRYAIWYASMWGRNPTITLQADRQRQPVIRKDYTLVEAEASCLVVGLIRDKPRDTMCLYFMAKKSIKKNHTRCKNAYKTNCKVATGVKYRWRRHCNRQNRPKLKK
ncbi:uncharacterized protein LOC119454385 [Dermacentor silvarum]|uniref:uncharacterized protein LOC119454385 n=1 Tax=Dermacentor silvarum TaxID=543639 RepID=UPI002100E426|nr:uncharacterized protein LOC119454385 [Dermacentor silvarum]